MYPESVTKVGTSRTVKISSSEVKTVEDQEKTKSLLTPATISYHRDHRDHAQKSDDSKRKLVHRPKYQGEKKQPTSTSSSSAKTRPQSSYGRRPATGQVINVAEKKVVNDKVVASLPCPQGCPTSAKNFASLDLETTKDYNDLLVFLTVNSNLLRGSVMNFVKWLEECRDQGSEIPIAVADKFSETERQHRGVGAWSNKKSDDHNCWCWSSGNDEEGYTTNINFCRLH
jgi:hypothetical protein